MFVSFKIGQNLFLLSRNVEITLRVSAAAAYNKEVNNIKHLKKYKLKMWLTLYLNMHKHRDVHGLQDHIAQR